MDLDQEAQICGFCKSTLIQGSYTPANPDPCAVNGGSPCQIYTRVSELEKAIQAAQETLLRLVKEHTLLMSEVNEHHDRLRSLPTEVVSHIFLLCFPVEPTSLSKSNGYIESPEGFPLMLGGICRRWRQIAWSTPHLWSTIHVYPGRPYQNYIAPSWVDRSGQLALTIRVRMKNPQRVLSTDDYPDKLIRTIREVSHRWSILELYVTRLAAIRMFSDGYEAPKHHLRYLGIQVFDSLRHGRDQGNTPLISYSLPKANRLRLDAFPIDDNITAVDLPESTWLRISKIWVHEVVNVLYSAHSLRTLGLVECPGCQHLPLHPTPIVLPSLKVMKINKSSGILHFTTAPVLQELIICNETPLLSSITSFLIRGSPSRLRVLSISFVVWDNKHEVMKSLQLLDQLSSLTIDHKLTLYQLSFVNDDFLKCIGSRSFAPDGVTSFPFLPSLEYFSYEGPDHFKWKCLPDLFKTLDNPTHKRLKTVKIRIEDAYNIRSNSDVGSDLMDAETADKLYKLEPGLLSVSVVYGENIVKDLVGTSYRTYH